MKSAGAYYGGLFASLIILVMIAVCFAPKGGPAKFSLPPSDVFVSSYGAQDAIHRIIYQGLFGFGTRMANADVLIVGNSHAELGFSAEQISKALSFQAGHLIKVMNLAVGWGESFSFQKRVFDNNNLKCKVVLLELYRTLTQTNFSNVGRPILLEDRITSYVKVLETWTVLRRDWLLDGIFPRITYANNKFVVQRFLMYPVGFRKWANGDVFDYWIPGWGAVFQKTPAFLISYPKVAEHKRTGDVELIRDMLNLTLLHNRNLQIVTTLIPSNKVDQALYVEPIQQLGLPYIKISYDGIELYDWAHVNSAGRLLATSKMLTQWRNNPVQNSSQALQSLNSCLGSLPKNVSG
ncbi:MAG: hypothetical protein ABI597_03795 [Gammaproteobacteria bacterium]